MQPIEIQRPGRNYQKKHLVKPSYTPASKETGSPKTEISIPSVSIHNLHITGRTSASPETSNTFK